MHCNKGNEERALSSSRSPDLRISRCPVGVLNTRCPNCFSPKLLLTPSAPLSWAASSFSPCWPYPAVSTLLPVSEAQPSVVPAMQSLLISLPVTVISPQDYRNGLLSGLPTSALVLCAPPQHALSATLRGNLLECLSARGTPPFRSIPWFPLSPA